MNKSKLIFAVFFGWISVHVFSLDVMGRLEEETETPVIFKNLNTVILIQELDKLTTPNDDGTFSFSGIKAGTLTLAIIIPDVQEYQIKINVPLTEPVAIRIKLMSIPLEIAENKKQFPPGLVKCKKDLEDIKNNPEIFKKKPSTQGIDIGMLVQTIYDLTVGRSRRNK
jgi:hypothetical protein